MALTAKKVYAILKRQISDMEAKIKTPIIYRGTVATADLLPLNPDMEICTISSLNLSMAKQE